MALISNIQVLRAVAALNVVYFHIIPTATSYGQSVSLLAFLEGWGRNGVDIFFVISGFVMVYTNSLKPKSGWEFMRNRMVRIIPIYWILSAGFLVLYYALPSAFRELKVDMPTVVSSLLFVSGVFTTGQPLVYVGWTLEYEMLFYLLFSLALLARCRGYVQLALCTVVLGALALFGLIQWMVMEFVCGMLVARVFLAGRLAGWGKVAAVIGSVLLALSIGGEGGLDRALIFGIPAVLIVFGALHLAPTRNRLFIYLGAASYSIYLVQIFTIPAFYKFSSKFLMGVNADLVSTFCIVLTAACGSLVYSLIEQPVSTWIARRRAQPRARSCVGEA